MQVVGVSGHKHPMPQGPSVKDMMSSVTNRFHTGSSSCETATSKEHYQISSSFKAEFDTDNKFDSRVSKLNSMAMSETASSKQRNITNSTRRTLIKQKAKGNVNVEVGAAL
jgi:hypothetical protein